MNKIKNFIKGLGRVIDIIPVKTKISYQIKSDHESLKSDWEKIGNDFYKVIIREKEKKYNPRSH
ncbi:MAG: hypothetical protein HQK78_00190 [Desulfobacterales bacterium]|nr:hypothetical protein [Desulfobacterales bacterium]